MSVEDNNHKLSNDILVGRMIDGQLQTQVSVRGPVVVVGFYNRSTLRGFELSFSPKALLEFNELVQAAARLAEGKL